MRSLTKLYLVHRSRPVTVAFQATLEAGATDVEDLAQQHFPLCMEHLFNKVREDHHLKHNGRLQLTLFLKVTTHQKDRLQFLFRELGSL